MDFFIPITNSPEQIYLTALPLMPTCGLLKLHTAHASGSQHAVKLVSPRQQQWDACLRVIEGHEKQVSLVKFSPNGRWIVSGAWDNTIRIWDSTTGIIWKTLEGHNDSVESVDFHPDGLHVASGSSDGTVREWDPSSNLPMTRTHLVRCGNVFSVAYSNDGSKLVSGSYQSVVHVWHAERDSASSTLR